jgi:hypothetical protein
LKNIRTKDGEPVVADQSARETDQDWREGRQPRALCDLPTRRGRGVAADVPGDLVTDRPVAGAAGTSVTGRERQMLETTTAEVCPDGGQATSSSV